MAMITRLLKNSVEIAPCRRGSDGVVRFSGATNGDAARKTAYATKPKLTARYRAATAGSAHAIFSP